LPPAAQRSTGPETTGFGDRQGQTCWSWPWRIDVEKRFARP